MFGNFMGNFRDKLIRFMYGRYGVDQLYFASMIVCFILLVINSFFRSPIIGVIVWAILAWMILGLCLKIFTKGVWKMKSF